MDKQMSTRVIWAVILITGIGLLMLALLIGSIQLFSVDGLGDYFLAPDFRKDPPIDDLKWSLYSIIGMVIATAGLLSLVWVLIVSFGSDIFAPGYARRKRGVWWACLVLGAVAAAVAGYFLGNAPWLAGDVPPEIAMGCSFLFLVGYWLATIFSTPFMVRSGVPFGNLIAGHIRFP